MLTAGAYNLFNKSCQAYSEGQTVNLVTSWWLHRRAPLLTAAQHAMGTMVTLTGAPLELSSTDDELYWRYAPLELSSTDDDLYWRYAPLELSSTDDELYWRYAPLELNLTTMSSTEYELYCRWAALNELHWMSCTALARELHWGEAALALAAECSVCVERRRPTACVVSRHLRARASALLGGLPPPQSYPLPCNIVPILLTSIILAWLQMWAKCLSTLLTLWRPWSVGVFRTAQEHAFFALQFATFHREHYYEWLRTKDIYRSWTKINRRKCLLFMRTILADENNPSRQNKGESYGRFLLFCPVGSSRYLLCHFNK